MNKHFFLLFLFLLLFAFCFAQKKEKNETSAIIEAPNDWSKESFPLPPSFAPTLTFTGIEQVRFAPGWADTSSAQFWTYTFAWYVDGKQQLTDKSLNQLMKDYFSGLTTSVGKSNGIAAEKITKSTASFTARKAADGRQFFEGKVELYDVFFTRKQIKLNVKVKENYCPQVDKHLMMFSFSPKSFDNQVWKGFDQVRSATDCKQLQQTPTSYITRNSEHYELILPKGNLNGILILFPGFPENAGIIKSEFKILEPAISKGIAIALMNFNRRLWLKKDEKIQLSAIIHQMFKENNLENKNVYIGGFSSGGNIGLLLSNYLMQTQKGIKPKGVFIIDSPVDLLGLYENAQKNILRNFSPGSVEESKMIVDLLESNFGKPQKGIEKYEEFAVYTKKTHNTNNLSYLKDVKIRLYTEPDTLWWKQNRMNAYEEMNAYFIKSLSDELTKKFGDKVEYIPTKNRGYRSNGTRHPHSWSIVEVDELIKWIRDE